VDYKNSEYGFSIKHPAEWESQEALKPQELKALHDIVFSAKEYEMMRPSLTVRIFVNDNNQTLDEWWNSWLAEEDIKKQECIAEYGEGNAPCLVLRDLVEREEKTTLAGQNALSVDFFRFDSEERCVYIARGAYIYTLCYDNANPNDPNFEVNKKITGNMKDSFAFQEISSKTNGIIGSWQSTDDAKSVKVFKDGGVTEDVHDGKTISSGTWEILDSFQPSGADDVVKGTFLKVMIDSEEYMYTVVSVNETELELTYLARGNTLRYERVVE